MIRLNWEKASGWQLTPRNFWPFFYKSNFPDSPEIVENTLSGSNLPASISSNCLRTRLALGSASLLSLLLRGFRTGLCTTTYWGKIQPSLLVEFLKHAPKETFNRSLESSQLDSTLIYTTTEIRLEMASPPFFVNIFSYLPPLVFLQSHGSFVSLLPIFQWSVPPLQVSSPSTSAVLPPRSASAPRPRARCPRRPHGSWWQRPGRSQDEPIFFRMVQLLLLRFEGRKDDMVAFEVWIKDSACTPQGHTP